MSETFTEFTRQGYFARIGSSVVGAIAGVLFLVIAVVLLFWNEALASGSWRSSAPPL
jgi:uncharacterized membrane protein required for colicin V production